MHSHTSATNPNFDAEDQIISAALSNLAATECVPDTIEQRVLERISRPADKLVFSRAAVVRIITVSVLLCLAGIVAFFMLVEPQLPIASVHVSAVPLPNLGSLLHSVSALAVGAVALVVVLTLALETRTR